MKFMDNVLCVHVFTSQGYVPRSEISRSGGKSILRNGQTVFQSGRMVLYSHQQFLHNLINALFLSFIFIVTIPVDVK